MRGLVITSRYGLEHVMHIMAFDRFLLSIGSAPMAQRQRLLT